MHILEIKNKQIQIAKNRFPTLMNWQDAKSACEALGEGWRLPNREELNEMYKNKELFEGFTSGEPEEHGYYWSSSDDCEGDNTLAWGQDLSSNEYYANYYPKDFLFWVRVLRSMN